MDHKKRLLEILSRLTSKEVGEIRPHMELVADLGIDSPKALELLVEIEEELGIEISDEDAARMDRVSDILDYLAGSTTP